MEYDDIQLIRLLQKAFEAAGKKDPNTGKALLKRHAEWQKAKGIDSYWIRTGRDKQYDTHH